MSPLRGEEFTGRSVEEAIERGLRSLGKKRTEVDIEILEKGKPANVLGIGGEDARVLLTFQEEEAAAEPEPLIDEAEVPRRPDAALRERDIESEEAPPALAEELAAAVTVLRDLLDLMGVEAEVTMDDRPRHEGIEVLGADLGALIGRGGENRSEEHTSELQSLAYLVCRLLLEKKKKIFKIISRIYRARVAEAEIVR